MQKKIDVLYVSTLCSEKIIREMMELNLGRTNLAAQKFHRLIAQGMALNEDLFDIKVLAVPDYQKSLTINRVIVKADEIEYGVKYTYVPIVLIPIIKRIVVTLYLCYKILNWRFTGKFGKRMVVFDILNTGTAVVAVLLSKLMWFRAVAVVTDLPTFMYVLKDRKSLVNKLTIRLQNLLLHFSDGFIFLTEEMNNAVNRTSKAYCIIEGLSDSRLLSHVAETTNRNNLKIFHYSGGLYENFGIKTLVDAFLKLKNDDVRLHLYGSGDLENYIKECASNDTRIKFFGYKDNSEVLKDQLQSLVLLNPRFTHENYTRYSFPSKTIEYMASGIPLLTTKLPGIPIEYFDYVYLFTEENVDGYKTALERILMVPRKELDHFGKQAKNFVLTHKNNKVQTVKIYNAFSTEV